MRKILFSITYSIIGILPSYAQVNQSDFNCTDTIFIISYKHIGFENLNNTVNVYYSGNNTFFIKRFSNHKNPSLKSVIGQAYIDCFNCNNCFYYIVKRKNGRLCAEGDWELGEYTFESKGKEYFRNGKIKMSFINNPDSAVWTFYRKNGRIKHIETIIRS